MACAPAVTAAKPWDRCQGVGQPGSDGALFIFVGEAKDDFFNPRLLEKIVDMPVKDFLFSKMPDNPWGKAV